MAQLLITGGAGFIGSHTCLVLLQEGHDLIVLDDHSNSSPVALKRVLALAGLQASGERSKEHLQLIQGDIRDITCVEKVFIDARNAGFECRGGAGCAEGRGWLGGGGDGSAYMWRCTLSCVGAP